MNRQNLLYCAWSGPLLMVLFGLGFWVFAQYMPPHQPGMSAEGIAAIFQTNANMIRIGQVFLIAAAALAVPFSAAISIQMMRIETRQPVLAYAQLGSGVLGAVFLLLPGLLWSAAAFRPERAVEITQFVNDLAWIILLFTFSPAFVQLVCIGLAILSDKTKTPVFPRWSGYVNLWVAVTFLPAALIPFFKSGPFAWDGLFGFWIPAGAFFGWLTLMSVLLVQVISKQRTE